ncbi:MAG: hypothetical protein ACE5MM_10460 [Nitrospiraceae bacterium]
MHADERGRTTKAADATQLLRDDFRRRLEIFYARLRLAPPYHTIEKAIGSLSTALTAMTQEERERTAEDPARQWAQYQAAFIQSGLNRKHRGIIAGLVRARRTHNLTPEFQPFLDAFMS